MSVLQDVAAHYRTARAFLGPFILIHLTLRLIAAAVMVPLSGLAFAVILRVSGRSALTDQDIARFLLTPAGFAIGLALIGLFLVTSVFDLAVMTETLRRQERSATRAVAAGLGLFLARFPRLFSFGVQLALRLLLIALPFLALAGGVAWLALGRYDINYYLTYRPPEFLATAAVCAVLLAILAVLLLQRLSSWSIALHLILFRGVTPRRSFWESARLLRGHRLAVLHRIAVWALIRALLAGLVAMIGGYLIGWVQHLVGAHLRLAALATIALMLLCALANAGVSSLANGALAALFGRLFIARTGMVPDPGEPDRRGWLPVPAMLGAAAALLAGGLVFGGGLLERVAAERTVEIIAHRGAAGSRPENTMAAFEQALADRADWIEIDVQETADGEVVVAHDSDFMKLAGVGLKVWDATMADLAGIDIGSWYEPAYAGERTPTLRQVLEAAKGRGKVLIELKYYGHDVELEPRVARIVNEAGMSSDVAVMSLKIPGVQKMQALAPGWPHGILAATALGDLAALDAEFLAVKAGQASLSLVRRSHAQGKKLYVWTINDPVAMTRMISMGVDGLITDEPALARRVMEERNRLTAPERLMLWLSDQLRLKTFDLAAEEGDA